MSRVGLRIGLVVTLLLVIAIGSAMAVDVEYSLIAPPAGAPWTSAGEVIIKFIDVDRQRTGVGADVIQITDPALGVRNFAGVEIEYGKTFTLKVETQYSEKMVIRFIDAETGTTAWSKEFTGSFSETIDTASANLKPGWYYIQIGPVPARAGVAGVTLVTAHDTNNNKVVDTQGDPTFGNVFLDAANNPFNILYVLPAENKALIEIELKNPSDEIAKGDLVTFEVRVYGRATFDWRLEGPYDMATRLLSARGVGLVDHKATITISTVDVIENREGGTGTYKFKVIDSGNPDNTKEYIFKVVDITITANVDKKEVPISSTVEVSGVTNIADTGDDYDDDDTLPGTLVNNPALMHPTVGYTVFTSDNLILMFLTEGTYVSKSELKIVPFDPAWGGVQAKIDDDNDGLVDEDPVNGADDDGDGVVDEDPPNIVGIGRGIDNDNDGLIDEDPVNGRDDDGDGVVDEDPVDSIIGPGRNVDNDCDGAFDEDPVDGRDNDGDGLVDEDPAEVIAGMHFAIWIAPVDVDTPTAEVVQNNRYTQDFLGIIDANGNWVARDDDDNDRVPDILDDDKGYLIRDVAVEDVADGEYSHEFDLSTLGLTKDNTGDWQIILMTFTRLNPTVIRIADHSVLDYSTSEVVYIKAVEPTVSINYIGVVARGETFKITGSAGVKSGCYVWIFVEDGKNNFDPNVFYQRTGIAARDEPQDEDPSDAILDVTIGAEKGNYIMVLVDTEGKFESPDIDVNPDARLGTYTVKAIVTDTNRGINVPDPDQNDWVASTSVEIKVVKQKLEVNVTSTAAVVGGKITIYGNSTTDYVYVFASEPNIFKDVAELPTQTRIPNPASITVRIPVVDGKFRKDLEVLPAVDEGTYILYVFAPSNPNLIDVASDAQDALSIVVRKIGITDYPSEVIIARGESKELKLKVNAEDDDHVAAYIKFEGKGIKYRYAGGAEIHPVNLTYTITIDPYYDGAALTPNPYDVDAAGRITVNDALPSGMYSLEIKLYECEQVGGQWRPKEEVQRLVIPITVKDVDYEVEVPASVTTGEKLVIKITSDPPRSDEYDDVYVVLAYELKEYVQTASFENGTAIVEFETYGLPLGKAKVYVRDTMGTVADQNGVQPYNPFDIRDYYDVSPVESFARTYGADDDILVIKEIEIVSAAAVTPTPTTPTPTTPAVTPTTPTPTTPTPTTPTPTTPITTPPTSPPPTTTTPSPGFEAIFAIAGLLAIAYLLRRR